MNINWKEAIKWIRDEFVLTSAPHFIFCPPPKVISSNINLVPKSEFDAEKDFGNQGGLLEFFRSKNVK